MSCTIISHQSCFAHSMSSHVMFGKSMSVMFAHSMSCHVMFRNFMAVMFAHSMSSHVMFRNFMAVMFAHSMSSHVMFRSPLFRTALRRRLRMPIWDSDTACGLCGEVLDRWGDHAICCSGGGDRVLRHNAVRNIVCSAVSEFTSVSPELEKPGLLLPPKPPDPGGSCPGSTPDQPPLSSAGRRPADVWVPVESRASLRPGTFRSPPSSVPPFSPPLSRLWLTFFTKLSPARTPSRTPPPRFLPWVPPSVRSSWRLAAGVGPTPFARSSRGFPLSRAPCAAQPATPPVTSAFELHSASAAPFTGKTRVQSLGGHPARSMALTI